MPLTYSNILHYNASFIKLPGEVSSDSSHDSSFGSELRDHSGEWGITYWFLKTTMFPIHLCVNTTTLASQLQGKSNLFFPLGELMPLHMLCISTPIIPHREQTFYCRSCLSFIFVFLVNIESMCPSSLSCKRNNFPFTFTSNFNLFFISVLHFTSGFLKSHQ